jgi:hypothetical protein
MKKGLYMNVIKDKGLKCYKWKINDQNVKKNKINDM